MRSVLVAVAASTLLAAPAAAEIPGLERVTICEVQLTVSSSGNPVDFGQVFRTGLDADITVLSDFGEITLCEAFGEKEAAKLCKKNNRRGRIADTASILFSFKKAIEDPNPPEPSCAGPTDPHCLDPLTQAFKFDTFDADAVNLPCADLLDG